MSKTRKMRARLRLKAVDDVIATVEASGVQTHSLVSCAFPCSFSLSALAHLILH